METTIYKKEPVRKIYIQTPIEENPKTDVPYLTAVGILSFEDGEWTDDYSNTVLPPINYLKPVSVSEVPDDKIIDERYTVGGLNYPSSAEFPHPNNFRRQGAKEMRDQLLPTIALLKEEVEEFKKLRNLAVKNIVRLRQENNSLREENEKLKARIAELEGEDFPPIPPFFDVTF